MCFDLKLDQLTLPQLKQYCNRYKLLLSQPTILARLPDNGDKLRRVYEEIKKEIEMRELLERSMTQLEKLEIKSSSDSTLDTQHAARLCKYDKTPAQERFRPSLNIRQLPAKESKSNVELRSGTLLIDLPTSVKLQKAQKKRLEETKTKLCRVEATFAEAEPGPISAHGSNIDFEEVNDDGSEGEEEVYAEHHDEEGENEPAADNIEAELDSDDEEDGAAGAGCDLVVGQPNEQDAAHSDDLENGDKPSSSKGADNADDLSEPGPSDEFYFDDIIAACYSKKSSSSSSDSDDDDDGDPENRIDLVVEGRAIFPPNEDNN